MRSRDTKDIVIGDNGVTNDTLWSLASWEESWLTPVGGERGTAADWDRDTERHHTHKTRQKIMERREQGLPLWPSRDKKSRRVVFFPSSLSFLGVWKRKNRVGLIDTNLPWGFLLFFCFYFFAPSRLFPSIHPYFSFVSHRKEFWSSQGTEHIQTQSFSDTETLVPVYIFIFSHIRANTKLLGPIDCDRLVNKTDIGRQIDTVS